VSALDRECGETLTALAGVLADEGRRTPILWRSVCAPCGRAVDNGGTEGNAEKCAFRELEIFKTVQQIRLNN